MRGRSDAKTDSQFSSTLSGAYRPRRSLEGVVVIERAGIPRGGAVPSRDNPANAAAGRPPCQPAEGVAAAETWLPLRGGMGVEGRGYCDEGRSLAVTVPTRSARRPLVSLRGAGLSLRGVAIPKAEPRRGSSSRPRRTRPAPAAARRPAPARPSALLRRRQRGAGVPKPGVGVQRGGIAEPGAERSAPAPRSPPPAFPGRRRASSRARPQLSGAPPVAGGPRPPPSA